MCIYDLLQVLLIKTHIRSSYKPVHLTLWHSVSHLTLISSSLLSLSKVIWLNAFSFWTLYMGASTVFCCVNVNLIGCLEQICELAWAFLDVRMRILWFWLWWRCFYIEEFQAILSPQREQECHKHLYPHVSRHARIVGACTCVYVHALLPSDGHYQICVSAGSPLCPHVFGFHYYLIAANKQFMSLNWGNTLHPDIRLSNHHDFLSLSSSSCWK